MFRHNLKTWKGFWAQTQTEKYTIVTKVAQKLHQDFNNFLSPGIMVTILTRIILSFDLEIHLKVSFQFMSPYGRM